MPIDLLDRTIIIPTAAYDEKELKQILKIRSVFYYFNHSAIGTQIIILTTSICYYRLHISIL